MHTAEEIQNAHYKLIRTLGKMVKDCTYEELTKDFKDKRDIVDTLDRYKDKLKIKLMQEDLYAINIVLKEIDK